MGYESWTVEIEFESGTWTDVTAYADTAQFPFEVTSGDTPEASADSGGVGLPLQNSDQRFTPGNTLSPYYPNITPGKRCRIRDTIDSQVFDLFTGYLDFPEILSWAQSTTTTPRDQTIVIPFVDLTAKLANARTFVSALAEHIAYVGGARLKGYWPLTQAREPFLGIGPTPDPVQLDVDSGGTFPPAPTLEPQTGTAPTGGESSGLRLPVTTLSATAAGSAFNHYTLQTPDTLTPDIDSDTLTVVAWLSINSYDGLSNDLALITLSGGPTVRLSHNGGDAWTLVASGSMSGTITAGAVGTEVLLPIAMQVTPSTSDMRLWIGGQEATVSLTGGPDASASLTAVSFNARTSYDLSHLQVYVGDYTRDEFMAQIAQASAPLHRQTTGDRIRTILRYAGIGEDFDRIDDGAAVMGTATLAGRKPIDLITDAVATEQGEFYADGSGRPVFADRLRLYNV